LLASWVSADRGLPGLSHSTCPLEHALAAPGGRANVSCAMLAVRSSGLLQPQRPVASSEVVVACAPDFGLRAATLPKPSEFRGWPQSRLDATLRLCIWRELTSEGETSSHPSLWVVHVMESSSGSPGQASLGLPIVAPSWRRACSRRLVDYFLEGPRRCRDRAVSPPGEDDLGLPTPVPKASMRVLHFMRWRSRCM
jgi:hypothetical protein